MGLDVAEMIMVFEEAFEVAISDDVCAARTLGELAELLHAELAGRLGLSRTQIRLGLREIAVELTGLDPDSIGPDFEIHFGGGA